MKNNNLSKFFDKPQIYECKYGNGAKFTATYYPEPDGKFPYEDRIEIKFKTHTKDDFAMRMTFAEAIVVAKGLLIAIDSFMDDKSNNENFDIPLEAKP